MWPICRSRSLQSVHLSDNEIPEQQLRTLLFVFGIHNANEGDLLDHSNPSKIEKFSQIKKNENFFYNDDPNAKTSQCMYIPLDDGAIAS